jgi:RoxA-like, cytochrome c-like
MTTRRKWGRKAAWTLIVLGALTVVVGGFAWFKFFREVSQPEFASQEMRFKYGSLGGEQDRGIPYWIWIVLPRIFPEYLPGPGGYGSFGFPWEEGQELPVGFAKKTVGFPRVTNNCALCHTATYRTTEQETPTFVVAGPSHTSNLQGYIRFLSTAAADPRFNSKVLLREIELIYDLPWLDEQLYRFIIIPATKKALLEQDDQFAWMNRHGWTDWGPGRDDPMNLTKYFMTQLPVDESIGNADFPSVWNLKIREGQSLNWGGETLTSRAVVIDSALGLGAPPANLKLMEEIDAYLKELPPPAYPFPVDETLAEQGRPLYEAHCAGCHEGGERDNLVPIDDVGTDRERLDTWTEAAADKANVVVRGFGIKRENMRKTEGYVGEPLDGLWLRAPYLHNGSVPSLRDLLRPPAERTETFWRGYDVYDPHDVGFVCQGEEAQRVGHCFDTKVRGNGNLGHEYGTMLAAPEKEALLEYLKTL